MTMPEQAAKHFVVPGESIAAVEPHGRGIIHDTYLVKLSRRHDQFILQRINTQVFKHPESIMHNLQVVCEHVQNREIPAGSRILSGWQMVKTIPTQDGRNFFIGPEGDFWRALGLSGVQDPWRALSE